MFEHLKQLDTNLFLYLNGLHHPFWDEVMYHVSFRFIWIPLYAFILFLFLKKYKRKSIIPILSAILLIILSDQISVHFFKDVFERLRPCHNPEIKNMVHLVHNHCGGKYGFISSHASNSFALACFTLLSIKKTGYTYTILFWAFLVSYSRIYLGVHYPGDVLCGALFGVLLGYSMYVLSRKVVRRVYNG